MRAIWIIAVVLAAACTGKKAKEKPVEKVTVVTDAALSPDAAPAADGGTTLGALPLPAKIDGPARADLEAFVARWLDSQNQGDFATYQTYYGDRFHGVRRSGRVVKRFDRAGWMRDRGAMFKRPMTVKADDLVAYAVGDRRQVFFTQTWSQGSYKDVGTKTMVVTGKGDDLRVVYEELLQSRIQDADPPPVVAPGGGETFYGYDLASTPADMRLARLDGKEVLLGYTLREIAWVDPEIGEQHRDAASGQYRSAVIDADLPDGDPLGALEGTVVTVLDQNLDAACTGKLGQPSLRFAGFVDDVEDDDDLIAKARVSHDLYIVAPLEAPCTGAFVRGDKAGVVADVEATELPDRALRSLEGEITSAVSGKSGYVLVSNHVEDSCETQEKYTWALHKAVQKGSKWELTPAEDGEDEDDELRVLDIDGDGELDALTARGAYVGGRWTTWEPDLRFFWPAGLGCDGYDPEDEEETVGD